jgi:hypothetical protein
VTQVHPASGGTWSPADLRYSAGYALSRGVTTEIGDKDDKKRKVGKK